MLWMFYHDNDWGRKCRIYGILFVHRCRMDSHKHYKYLSFLSCDKRFVGPASRSSFLLTVKKRTRFVFLFYEVNTPHLEQDSASCSNGSPQCLQYCWRWWNMSTITMIIIATSIAIATSSINAHGMGFTGVGGGPLAVISVIVVEDEIVVHMVPFTV